MRGFQVDGLGEVIRLGLRRFEHSKINSFELVECFNLAPAEKGLEPHIPIVSLNSDRVWAGEVKKVVDIVDTIDVDIDDSVIEDSDY